MTLWACAGLSPLLPMPVVVFRKGIGDLPFEWVAYWCVSGGDLVKLGFRLNEGTCDLSWLSWGLVSPPSFWIFPRSWSWYQMTVCTGPLPLTGLMWYTFSSGCFPTTTNFSLLYWSWIFLLWLSGWSHNETKFSSGISSDFWFNLSVLFCVICQKLFNAHLFTAHTNSFFCWTHESFEMDSLQLYWDNPNQLSQCVWALWPNISWYGRYPVDELGVALYVSTKATRWVDQLHLWSLGSVFNRFCNVQFSCSHDELPQGLYGVMLDCFTS